MRNKNELKSDSNYPENFWPKILTLLSIGAFVFLVMTSQNAEKFSINIFLTQFSDYLTE